MFQMSEQYLPYADGTMIIVISGSKVRIFGANGRVVEEQEGLESKSSEETRERQNYADGHTDAEDAQRRRALYKKVGKYLENKNPTALILCAPEAYQNEVKESLTQSVQDRITHFVAKNLASLPIDAIVRILQEKQA